MKAGALLLTIFTEFIIIIDYLVLDAIIRL